MKLLKNIHVSTMAITEIIVHIFVKTPLGLAIIDVLHNKKNARDTPYIARYVFAYTGFGFHKNTT